MDPIQEIFTKDILSNLGGALNGAGWAAKKPEIAFIGSGIAYYGSVLGLSESISAKQVVHTINPGG